MEIDFLQWSYRLAVAIAIGLLIGIERGWKGRKAQEGEREIGLRTLALIGLVGGLAGFLGSEFGGLLIGLIFVGLAILLGLVYRIKSHERDDIGLTTEIAALATFLLATLAGLGQLAIASAGAVVMALLLTYKSQLHGWLRALDRPELLAAFKLLLISVVLLPLLPNKGFGPWQALNPYVIWWMVVLIAAISFVGYFAIRIAGARAGTIFTALAGGLASSTATTLNLARLARRQNANTSLLAGGILLACGTMFPRMLLVATLIHAPLFSLLVWPAATMALLTYAPALWLLRKPRKAPSGEDMLPHNPLELTSALTFGGLLALVMLLGKALTEWFGDAGVYALAAASGIADVDAITLSLARMGSDDLTAITAVLGIVIAASVNSLVKAGMAGVIGGRKLGLAAGLPLGIAVAAGLAVVLLVRF
ncbi:MAG: MgtC/SapB family protein [Wenzhouxiangellaceae bacterium]|nr:MgtC/SapB family protein [Wenzhouxiangellaceae bacterium]MBS3747497.1 MgtC/SapB family protein [Wenzhouxiangellaceae bacterium]MBS3823624.1 MgtC/SapB family protein [Wenzhouxiangellaceae bacterium]